MFGLDRVLWNVEGFPEERGQAWGDGGSRSTSKVFPSRPRLCLFYLLWKKILYDRNKTVEPTGGKSVKRDIKSFSITVKPYVKICKLLTISASETEIDRL